MDVANVPAMVNRVSYTGELGYEIWVAPEYQRRLYRQIRAAGRPLRLVLFGMRALLSMRLEKNYPDLVPRAAPDIRTLRGRDSTASSISASPSSSAARRPPRKRRRAASCVA